MMMFGIWQKKDCKGISLEGYFDLELDADLQIVRLRRLL